jgi:hypothetical protein
MEDPTISASPHRVSAAAWVARIVGASVIFVLVCFMLFWPMWHSGELKIKLGVACGDMIAQMRQQPMSGAGFTQAVAHSDCWPAQAAR